MMLKFYFAFVGYAKRSMKLCFEYKVIIFVPSVT